VLVRVKKTERDNWLCVVCCHSVKENEKNGFVGFKTEEKGKKGVKQSRYTWKTDKMTWNKKKRKKERKGDNFGHAQHSCNRGVIYLQKICVAQEVVHVGGENQTLGLGPSQDLRTKGGKLKCLNGPELVQKSGCSVD